jgi:putative nucleotidyltransferase with HDIG domain
MPTARTFLQTRIARRVFGLFLLCAVVPTVTLAVSGYWLVSSEMRSQAGLQLAQASKISGTLLLARLHAADQPFSAIVPAAVEGRQDSTDGAPGSPFRRLSVLGEGEAPGTYWGGSRGDFSKVAGRLTDHLRSGRAAIIVVGADHAIPRVYLVRDLSPGALGGRRLWAELSPEFLWGDRESESLAPPGVDLCVYGSRPPRMLYCTPAADQLGARDGTWRQGQNSQIVERREEEVVTGSSSVFLGFEFGSDPWTVVLQEPLVSLSAAGEFQRSIGLTLVIGLAFVVLASNILLRQRLDPVARLQEGTRKLAAGDFSARVRVTTGDEFEDLAGSFNSMAAGLRDQFDLLAALQEVDHEALKADSETGIVAAAIPRFSALGRNRYGVVVCMARRAPEFSALSIWKTASDGTLLREDTHVASSDLDALREQAAWSDVAPSGGGDALLGVLGVAGSARFQILPLLEHGACFGAVVLVAGPDQPGAMPPEDGSRLRQLADQVALALSHYMLLERLNAMSWGTLEALARTIDANSPWTAGHSERVTTIAMAIGRQLGLGADQIDRLHRGGLLHDVGKIGIPSAVLDKPDKLDAREMALVRAHPVLGARILEPIEAYEDVIGIVRHHHERYDGEGYPDRLAGTGIPFLARVLAVADVYDALVSDRPYRAGWLPDLAIRHIQDHAGRHFDPDIVSAFLELVNGEEWARIERADAAASRRPTTRVGT